MINYVIRNIAEYPILLILPYRPDDGLPDWSSAEHAINLPLGDLSDDACMEIVHGLVGPIDLPKAMRQLILNKGGGNPFFVEEVLRALIGADALQKDDSGEWQVVKGQMAVDLPDSIHGIIISRIHYKA